MLEIIRFVIFPILAAACAGSAGSFLWYAVFLKKDGPASKEAAMEAKPPRSLKDIFRASLAAHIFSAAAVWMLIIIFQIDSFQQGLQLIFAAWILLIALSGFKKIIMEKKSWENFILGAGHDFLNILILFLALMPLIKR